MHTYRVRVASSGNRESSSSFCYSSRAAVRSRCFGEERPAVYRTALRMHAVQARLLAGLLMFVAVGATPKTSVMATEYLTVPGVAGPVTTPVKNAIEVTSTGFRATKPMTLKAPPFLFTKAVDATTPIFEKALKSGKAFQGDTILAVYEPNAKGAPVEIYSVKFYAATVTQIATASVETISMKYSAIELCVTAGNTCTAWDYISNKPTYP